MITVIALNGNPGVGKDTIADFLVEDFGFTKLSFSDSLREMCAALDPIVDGYDCVRWSDQIRDLGYEEAKRDCPEMRRFMIALAEDVIKPVAPKAFAIATYNKLLEARDQGHRKFVVSDMRFFVEHDQFSDCGTLLVRVVRGPAPIPESEDDLCDYVDYLITNNRGLDDLHSMTHDLADFAIRRTPR